MNREEIMVFMSVWTIAALPWSGSLKGTLSVIYSMIEQSKASIGPQRMRREERMV
jgi:hypothetical protein